MLLEKERIRRIIREHKINSFRNQDEEEMANILYETFIELRSIQEDRLATKDDIRMILEMMDKRFEAMDKRFEAVDKRFEDMNKRFEAVDKRFEDMNNRFEAVDKRFEDLNNRFEDLNKKFSVMLTYMNIGLGLIIILTSIYHFLG